MLIVICLILIGLLLWFWLDCFDDYIVAIEAIVLGICALFLIFNIASIATSHTIDQKIAMYEEENAKIQATLSATVENYLEHEKGILTDLNPEDATVVLASYPELKSDTIVASQMENYVKNTEEIKSLKKDKINISKKKWWVYFGK